MPGRTNSPCAPALFILMAATLTSSALAQLRISPTQPSSELCKISGIVRDSLTNQPIERALADGQWDATLTDNEGRFELHLPCGGYTQLQVRRPGYSNAQGADAVPVQVEPDTPEITLKLTPLAIITGHVSISNGGDLGDLYFRAFKSDYRNGHLWWSFAGQAKTDTNGAFQMYGLDSPAGYLLCSQQAQEHFGVAPIASVTYGYPTTCYPSAMGTGGDGLLPLARGQHADVEISITRQPFYRVSIAVNAPPGQRQGIDIRSHNGASVNASMRWKEEDQSWEAWLPSGAYYAESRSWNGTLAYGRADFKVADTAVSGVRVSLLPLAPVEVLIHRLITAKRNEQQINEADPGLQLELIPVERSLEGSRGGGVGLRHSEEEAPGHFEAMGVTPGRYWVQVPWVQGGYISTISSGSTDLTREPLIIGPGNTVQPIEVTIRNDGGMIDCTVNTPNADRQNPGPVSGKFSNIPTVYVVPAGPRLSGFPQAQIWGPNGNAHFENLAPGLYHVVALSRFRDLNNVDPAELANLMAQGKSVTVEAGATTSVRVDFGKSEAEEPNP